MDGESDELDALQQEFQWLLKEEVNDILSQLHDIIVECSRRFPVRLDSNIQSLVKSEKFTLTASGAHNDHLKISTVLTGDALDNTDINIRMHKLSVPNQRFTIANGNYWKLNQIQDAANHLMAALDILSNPPLRFKYEEGKYDFATADEVIQLINSIMTYLQQGRNALFVPKRRTTDELQSSRNMKMLQPHAPHDLAISFYIQSHKLVCAVYLITKDSQNNVRYESLSAETSIPWLSEALVLFTLCLQFCQQLKDKLGVFIQYREMHRNLPTAHESPSPSTEEQRCTL